ncbi:2560_t:CDS:2 [Paraglomus brasilianum]|uniref:2560_t:CDS:1 n=1 Tax=Paraglomus brasilianum TaxID=144538 RepID=A0A9N9CTT5_9GLOM|nr:2560_t:CDS:2 [Paraglomus brasilianum]
MSTTHSLSSTHSCTSIEPKTHVEDDPRQSVISSSQPTIDHRANANISGDYNHVTNYYGSYPALENSPIESVRATVSMNDDKSLPCMTFRYWVLSTLTTVFGAALSQYYYFTTMPMTVSVFIAQLVSYPLGVAMARYLPQKEIKLFGMKFTLNPGPFNVKEHAVIGVTASAASYYPYAIHAISAQRLFFSHDFGHVANLLFLLSSQCLGFGLAGIFYKLLVETPQMVWPSTLVNVAFLNTLHERKYNFVRRLSRMQLFWAVFAAVFVWELFPSFIAPILVSVTILCYFNNTDPKFVTLGSGFQGLGILDVTFDWNWLIKFSLMATPWWAQANFFGGSLIFLWIVMPIVYYSNLWNTQNYNIISTIEYDSTGAVYNLSRIINKATDKVNSSLLNSYSEVYISSFFALTFACGFIAITSCFTHMFLWHGTDIWRKMKKIASRFTESNITEKKKDNEDVLDTSTVRSAAESDTWARNQETLEQDACVHVLLMKAYPKVPVLWYAAIFAVSLTMAMMFAILWSTGLPFWGVIVAVLLSLVTILPVGIIQATANQQIGINILSEVLGGYMFSGQPVATYLFKVYSYWALQQCLMLLTSFKLGQYMKIPPRVILLAQLYGTVLSSLVMYLVMTFVIDTHANELRANTHPWASLYPGYFYTASVIWGAVGPSRIFGTTSPYRSLIWCWFVGFLLPVPFYLLNRKFPNSSFPWRSVNIPLIFLGASLTSQLAKNYLVSALIVGFTTQFLIYRYRHHLWRKYNYVLNAALDSGTQACVLLVFLLTNGFFTSIQFPVWAGNNPTNHEQCAVAPAGS